MKNLMDVLSSIDSANVCSYAFEDDIVLAGNIDKFTQEDVKRLNKLRYYASSDEVDNNL